MGHRDVFETRSIVEAADVLTVRAARVTRVADDEVELQLGGRVVRARRAVSCLARPLLGDRVAVLQDEAGRCLVTAILDREEHQGLVLSSDRALSIESTGDLHVRAGARLDLEAATELRARAPVLATIAGRWNAVCKSINVTAGEALLHSRMARLCGDLIDVVAQRIGVSAQHSHRVVDGVEQVRCRHWDLQASELAQLRAPTTLIKATHLAKVDAGQVQIG